MLLVRARARVSKIHGIGLIAQEHIGRGFRVWVFQPGFDLVLTEADIGSLAEAAKEQIRWYAYWDPWRNAYVLSVDDDRFTNHANDPNTANDGNSMTYTVRDIRAGEEITWDYRGWGGIDWDNRQAGVLEQADCTSSGASVNHEAATANG